MKYPEARGSQKFPLGFLSSQPGVHRSFDCQLQVFKCINQLVSSSALSAQCVSGDSDKLEYHCNPHDLFPYWLAYLIWMALLFRCCFMVLNIILLLAMKKKQICNKGWCAGCEWCQMLRGRWRNCKHENRASDYVHQLRSAWEDERTFWFPQDFKHWVKHLYHFSCNLSP